MTILDVNHLKKTYASPFSNTRTEALKDISFSVEPGEFVAVMGESGAGKSTLLNLLAALDHPTEGTVSIGGKEIGQLSKKELAAFRRNHLGFVFQDFNLLDTLTCKDNILLPMVLSGKTPSQMEAALLGIAGELGVERILSKYPYEISGGQRQRVAACRALIQHPDLLLADEPTGALDSRTSDGMLKTFEKLNAQGQTIVMVTHSVKAASYASRVLFIKDGRIFHQLNRGNKSREDQFEEISKVLTILARQERT